MCLFPLITLNWWTTTDLQIYTLSSKKNITYFEHCYFYIFFSLFELPGGSTFNSLVSFFNRTSWYSYLCSLHIYIREITAPPRPGTGNFSLEKHGGSNLLWNFSKSYEKLKIGTWKLWSRYMKNEVKERYNWNPLHFNLFLGI